MILEREEWDVDNRDQVTVGLEGTRIVVEALALVQVLSIAEAEELKQQLEGAIAEAKEKNE